MMDVTGLPSLSLDERIVLRTSERKDMFDDKFPDGEPAPKGATEVLEGASDHRSASSGSLSSLASASKRDGRDDDSTDEFGSGRSRSRANTFSSSIEEGGQIGRAHV